MSPNFLACDREQGLLLPPSVRDLLPEGHLAWFVLEAVEEIDLVDFYRVYRADGHGGAAHEPEMMVALLVYAYSVGVRSARAIERRCLEDVAFRVITANQTPDHATIARFRARHEQAISDLFTGVLGLCAKAGLVKVGVVAGWVQGYNAQALVGEGQIVLAAEISTDNYDTGNLEPMVATALQELAAAGANTTPGLVLADAGYWRNDAIEKIINEQHIQTLVAPDADKRKGPRPGRRGGLYGYTRQILATDAGAQLYLKRQGLVEPVFGQIKSNRGFRRFSRRGRSAVRSEWRLLTATHNLLKLHQHQLRGA